MHNENETWKWHAYFKNDSHSFYMKYVLGSSNNFENSMDWKYYTQL